MSATDDTVILRRDPAEIQREAAERVDRYHRQHRGDEIADLRAELARKGRESANQSALIERLEHTLRCVRAERDALLAERGAAMPRMFASVDGVRDWIAAEFQRQGCEVQRPPESKIVIARKGGNAVSVVVRPASPRLAWVQRITHGHLDDELTAAVEGFSATDRDGAWCVTLVEGCAS